MDERLLDGSLIRFRRAGVSAATTRAAAKGVRTNSLDSRIKHSGSPKSKGIYKMLLEATETCLLFNGMTVDQRNVVIEVMNEVRCVLGDEIITEGEDPTASADKDNFYVVGEGQFEITKGGKVVQNRAVGDIFGELALMHNSARQATVRCMSAEAVVWALPRNIFHEIQHLQALENVNTLVESLKHVELLSSLAPPQFQKLVDAFEVVYFGKGERILQQGDAGDAFFIILSGLVECKSDTSTASTELGRLEYFGERALLKDDTRAVNVDAISPVTVAKVTRDIFSDVLGPLQTIMETELTRRILRSVPILSHLTETERDQVLLKFKEFQYAPGEKIIAQGEAGDTFYIVKEGSVECFVGGALVKTIGNGGYFGERALIKSEPRAADVLAAGAVTCMALSREDFGAILGDLEPVLAHNMLKDALRAAPILRSLSSVQREMILDCFEFTDFKQGDLIFRQGDPGYSFVLIREGEVKCIKDEVEVATLKDGDYVGERSLLFNDPRACDVIVTSESCQTAFLVRETFEQCMGPIQDVLKRAMHKIDFDDLKPFCILGTGTFGTVKLVKHDPSGQTFAIKIVSKARVVAFHQQEHIMNEKRILSEIDHPFCVELITTFKDESHLYMVLEFLPGGELFSLLQKERRLSEGAASFYSCMVMLAFDYLHNRNFIYRDLKPENLMLDKKGYIRLVDFGFAKMIKDRTWTLCGTPEYLAPETIRNKGHGKGVDWWALGILIYEMMAGYPPFCGDTPMGTYKLILEGAIEFPKSMGMYGRDVVRRLLHPAYTKRLGCLRNGALDIKQHRYFCNIDMPELLKMRVPPPFVPNVKDNTDTSNFQSYQEPPKEQYVDDGSGWDNDF